MHGLVQRKRQLGVSLIEVLVAMLILAIGLLGMAGLQWRLQQSEMEAYQRSQALLLLNDMASRIKASRRVAASYVTAGALGAGMSCPAATASQQQRDVREWCLALQGAGEKQGANDVGALLGGRGCVQSLAGNEYMITVAWQGLVPLTAPPAGVACGAGNYNINASCANDVCRRVVTTVVRVGAL